MRVTPKEVKGNLRRARRYPAKALEKMENILAPIMVPTAMETASRRESFLSFM